MGATTINRYNTLYENMKRSFTVNQDGAQYSLGAFMRMKAHEASGESFLPATIEKKRETSALVAIRNFVSEKLAVKSAPTPEKTLRSFPLRTSLAACVCAFALCTILFSGAIIGSGVLRATTNGESYVAEVDYTEEDSIELQEENA